MSFFAIAIAAALAGSVLGQYGTNCAFQQCSHDNYLAQSCCSTSGLCCDYANGVNNGGNNGGYYPGNNNNKPGNCPSFNGRKKRSPQGRRESAGKHYPGNNGYRPGNNGGYYPGNNGGYRPGNNGGQGYNPGYNNGNNGGHGYNPGYNNGNNLGRCIRDSECSGTFKCCYLSGGYQCTQPNYYG